MKSGQSVQSTLMSSGKKRGDQLNVYRVKIYRGSKLLYVKYISAINPQYAIYEARGYVDLEIVDKVYYDVKQVD